MKLMRFDYDRKIGIKFSSGLVIMRTIPDWYWFLKKMIKKIL